MDTISNDLTIELQKCVDETSTTTTSTTDNEISKEKTVTEPVKENPIEFAVRIYLSDPESDSADYRACDDSVSVSLKEVINGKN